MSKKNLLKNLLLIFVSLVVIFIFLFFGNFFKQITAPANNEIENNAFLPDIETPQPTKNIIDFTPVPQTEQTPEPTGNAEPTSTPGPSMIYYEGDLVNIFFHPVIAYPELAFDGDDLDAGFKEWFVTAGEYKKILIELYQNNYILVDINEFYEIKHKDGKKMVVAKKILVPEGKKPFVLSVDDLNYYVYMKENGTVHKLVQDQNGGIAALTNTPDGGKLSYDLDIVTITEDFIKMYPDFSLRGARGILALTGYEGVLGYQTHKLDSSSYNQEKEQAGVIVNKLKEMGWRFASHSYGHLIMNEIADDKFLKDTQRWDKEVRSIIGDTELYIYPYGAGVEKQETKHKELKNRNFNVFFGVGPGFGYIDGPGYIYIDRRNIDGEYFRVYENKTDRLFDINKVIDKKLRGLE